MFSPLGLEASPVRICFLMEKYPPEHVCRLAHCWIDWLYDLYPILASRPTHSFKKTFWWSEFWHCILVVSSRTCCWKSSHLSTDKRLALCLKTLFVVVAISSFGFMMTVLVLSEGEGYILRVWSWLKVSPSCRCWYCGRLHGLWVRTECTMACSDIPMVSRSSG